MKLNMPQQKYGCAGCTCILDEEGYFWFYMDHQNPCRIHHAENKKLREEENAFHRASNIGFKLMDSGILRGDDATSAGIRKLVQDGVLRGDDDLAQAIHRLIKAGKIKIV